MSDVLCAWEATTLTQKLSDQTALPVILDLCNLFVLLDFEPIDTVAHCD